MSQETNGISLVVCSILEKEIRVLAKEHWQESAIISLCSMLHMRPDKLDERLDNILQEQLQLGCKIVLIYGDCCPTIIGWEKRRGVVRTKPLNCISLLLGRREYARFMHQGAFLLLPEWTMRWREIFAKELGLNEKNATELMRDMHRKLVYIDTGIAPIPRNELSACSEYCGLPFEIHATSLDLMRDSIEEAMQRLANY